MEEIEIIVKTDGTSTVEAKGFNGVGCTDATKVLRKHLEPLKIAKKNQNFLLNK